MNKESVLYGVIGFILGALLMMALASNAVNSQNSGVMRMMGIGIGGNMVQNTGTGNSIMDAHFIEQMIPHHEDAITMANLALERSNREEIRELAHNIIDSQSKEIGQMRDWYKDWYSRELPEGDEVMNIHGMGKGGRMHMGMMGSDTDMERLEGANDFDKAFIEEMIPHHQMAVMMASMLKNGTARPEMRQLADDIISAQTKEIEEMRGWYKSWGF
jgi:uncharacterized protein (DUF305 family)